MTRQPLLQSIATTVRDYREGEIPRPGPEHVDRWIRQFDSSVQEPMLAELDHVLKQSYLSRDYFLDFLRGLARLRCLPGVSSFWQTLWEALAAFVGFVRRGRGVEATRHSFWHDMNFLDIQQHGASQHEMLRLFEEVLGKNHQLSFSRCGSPTGSFLYLDDILFTGNRIIRDLHQWIVEEAPTRAEVVVVVIACYRHGLWYTHRAILRAADAAGKAIRLHWLRSTEFEDRYWVTSARDGFHPTVLPEDPLAKAYAQELAEAGFYPRFRVPTAGAPSRLFSSAAGRHLLEQQFLLAGLKIRSFCRNPKEAMRPLGYHSIPGFGFGATVVTYRNCPSNCPLAWWWGDPEVAPSHPLSRWYPLFPRKV